MTAPVLIAQITDLHIKQPGEKAYRVVDTAAALSRRSTTTISLPMPFILLKLWFASALMMPCYMANAAAMARAERAVSRQSRDRTRHQGS